MRASWAPPVRRVSRRGYRPSLRRRGKQTRGEGPGRRQGAVGAQPRGGRERGSLLRLGCWRRSRPRQEGLFGPDRGFEGRGEAAERRQKEERHNTLSTRASAPAQLRTANLPRREALSPASCSSMRSARGMLRCFGASARGRKSHKAVWAEAPGEAEVRHALGDERITLAHALIRALARRLRKLGYSMRTSSASWPRLPRCSSCS